VIDKNINYKDLADYVELAIEEYEFHNNKQIDNRSFYDLTDWLYHFHYCDANSRDIKERRAKK
jgi:hypothetical protein